ncbi:hypothetical protein ABFA07_002676 [Porites harrisoni]
MMTVVECGTQVDIRNIQDCEIRLLPHHNCTSVAVQVEEEDFEPQPADEKQIINDVEDARKPLEYRCDYCYGCLLCEKERPWYSLHGKACPWVLLLTPGYLVLGVILMPFFILIGLAYCVAAAIE